MMSFLVKLEKPFAYLAFSFALGTLIWKAFGVDWIPIMGDAWNGIFQNVSQDEESIAQYPRRSEAEDFWNITYLFMYGILGTLAQYGGILISTRNLPSRTHSSFGPESMVCFIA